MPHEGKQPLSKVPNPAGTGAPEYSEQQYNAWFDELSPYFKLGQTLNSAIFDAGLFRHKDSIYRKVRLNDWFCEKMVVLQGLPGKIANNILVGRTMAVQEKIKQSLPVSDEEMKDVRFVAEKHRTSQPYFVNRVEQKQVDEEEVGRVIDTIDKSDYGNLAEQAKKQVVEANPPVQDQGQAGESGNIPAQPDSTETPDPAGGA